MVELQGGTIIALSEERKGSSFGFIMNFKKSKSQEITNDGEPEVSYLDISKESTTKVLVVEDVVLNQLLLKIILLDFGFEIEIAENGKIAINLLQKNENEYDIILMDCQMPVMNGFETTSYIRNVLNSKIPIIALTADVTTSDVEKCN
ncbi:hypothetical protein CXF59_07320 [Flavobacterium sp. ALD4]|nr:hypothetical protein CXF59_07320 [Flavobacterium sp. ALD4]